MRLFVMAIIQNRDLCASPGFPYVNQTILQVKTPGKRDPLNLDVFWPTPLQPDKKIDLRFDFDQEPKIGIN